MCPPCKCSDLHALEAQLAGGKGGAGADPAGGPLTGTTHTAQHSTASTYILPTPAARAADRRVCADLTQTETLDITVSAQVHAHPGDSAQVCFRILLRAYRTGATCVGTSPAALRL
jgi:hypothetical protein